MLIALLSSGAVSKQDLRSAGEVVETPKKQIGRGQQTDIASS